MTDEEHRTEVLQKSLAEWSDAFLEHPRLMLSALYFRQAVRLNSYKESRIPQLNEGEVLLNLAKALEMLFGSRDKMREKCAKLSLTEDVIESQLVPIGLLRNSVDVAHAAAARLSPDDLEVLHDFVSRALWNVQQVLRQLMRLSKSQLESILDPLQEDATDRQKLLAKVREYLAASGIKLAS